MLVGPEKVPSASLPSAKSSSMDFESTSGRFGLKASPLALFEALQNLQGLHKEIANILQIVYHSFSSKLKMDAYLRFLQGRLC